MQIYQNIIKSYDLNITRTKINKILLKKNKKEHFL